MILKRITSMLVVLILLVLSSNQASAMRIVEPDAPSLSETIGYELNSDRQANACSGEGFGGDSNEKLLDYREGDSSIPEKFLIDIVILFTGIGEINTVSETIFGNPYCLWSENATNASMNYGVFTDKELDDVIKPAMLTFSGAFSILLIISIMISSFKFSLVTPSSRNGAEFAEDAKMWVMAILFLGLLWPFIELVFVMNNIFIDAFYTLMIEQGVDIDSFTLVSQGEYTSLTDVLLHFSEWVLTLAINAIYIARKLGLLLLLVLGPLSSAALLFKSTRQYFGTWIKTFIGVVFLASVHSLVFYVFIMISQVVTQVDSFFFKLGMMIMFIPLTSMAVNWLKLDNSSAEIGQESGRKVVSGAKKASQQVSSAAGVLKNATNKGTPKSPGSTPQMSTSLSTSAHKNTTGGNPMKKTSTANEKK